MLQCEHSPTSRQGGGRGKPLPVIESPPNLHRPSPPPLRYVHVIRSAGAATNTPGTAAAAAAAAAAPPQTNLRLSSGSAAVSALSTSLQETMGEAQETGAAASSSSSSLPPLFMAPPTASSLASFRLQPRHPGVVVAANNKKCTPSPEQTNTTAATSTTAISEQNCCRGRKRPASSCTANRNLLLVGQQEPARSTQDDEDRSISTTTNCSSNSSSSSSPKSRGGKVTAVEGTLLTLQGLTLQSPIVNRFSPAPSPQDLDHKQNATASVAAENSSTCSPSSSSFARAPGGGGCHSITFRSSSFSKYSSLSQPCSINRTSPTETSESTSNNNKEQHHGSSPPLCTGAASSSIKTSSPRFASLRVLSQHHTDASSSGNVDVKSPSTAVAAAAAHRPPRHGVVRTSTRNMFYSLSSPNGFFQHPETPPRQLVAPSYAASTGSSVSALQMSPDGEDSLDAISITNNDNAGFTPSSFKQRRTNLCHSPGAASDMMFLPPTHIGPTHTPLGGGARPTRPLFHHTPAASSSIASSGAATTSSFYSYRTPLPKLTLTPRSTGSRRNANSSANSQLPRFPSPTAWVDDSDSMMLMTPSDFTIGGVDPSPNAYITRTTVDMSFNSGILTNDELYHSVQAQGATDTPTELEADGELPATFALGQPSSSSPEWLVRRRPLPAASTRTNSFIPMPDWSATEPSRMMDPPSMNSPVVVANSRSLLAPSRSPDPLTIMLEYGATPNAVNNTCLNDGFLSDIDDDDEGGFVLASPGAIVEEKLAAQQHCRAKQRCLRRPSLTTDNANTSKRTSLSTMAGSTSRASNTSLLGIDFLASNTSLFGLDALTKGTSSGSLRYMSGTTTTNNNFRPGSPTKPTAETAAHSSSDDGGGMLTKRVESAVSIGLAIDNCTNEEVQQVTMAITPSGCCCREVLITPPPIMPQQMAFPRRLSPRNLKFEETQDGGGNKSNNNSSCQVDLSFPFEYHPHYYHTPTSA